MKTKEISLPQLNSEIVALANSLNESEISNFLYKKTENGYSPGLDGFTCE